MLFSVYTKLWSATINSFLSRLLYVEMIRVRRNVRTAIYVNYRPILVMLVIPRSANMTTHIKSFLWLPVDVRNTCKITCYILLICCLCDEEKSITIHLCQSIIYINYCNVLYGSEASSISIIAMCYMVVKLFLHIYEKHHLDFIGIKGIVKYFIDVLLQLVGLPSKHLVISNFASVSYIDRKPKK